MKRKELGNGLVKLTSDVGIVDIRTGTAYSEVVCKREAERFFEEVQADDRDAR